MHDDLAQSALGKKVAYSKTYDPGLLYPIPRQRNRERIGITDQVLPFHGFDCWNHYEVSWLNPKGKPHVALAKIYYDCVSPYLIESKSLKLYFNSLNDTVFKDENHLKDVLITDLSKAAGAIVTIELYPVTGTDHEVQGRCLDDLDIECNLREVDPSVLSVMPTQIDETVHSHLLRSNCPVTEQPDWGSVQIAYQGQAITHESLLRYIVSFRNHLEFHEQCIERMFIDIMLHCKPKSLLIKGHFTRRGGLDINPIRATHDKLLEYENTRLIRQ